MTRAVLLPLLLVLVTAGPPAGVRATALTARVVDAVTRQGLPNAIVTIGHTEIRTDPRGMFQVADPGTEVIGVRAYGYLRANAAVRSLTGRQPEIPLQAFRPKAVYLSVYGIGSRELRTAALELVDTSEINALVIDVKGDRGIIGYRSALPLATAVGAQRVITMRDLPGLIASLRERGIYTIARIVVFKDPLLAAGRPDVAVRRRDGAIYHDREGLAWVDPYSRDVWSYNIGVATEAAQAGFDEIQFDYVRLPDAEGLALQEPQTEANRVAPIDGFLREARQALTSSNVFLAADIFGYVCWNLNDTRIGQRLEHIASIVDYLSPMLYPSGFQFGLPGCRNPVEHPYEIVRRSLEEARERAAIPPVRFRPWLQGFRDYAFGGRRFTAAEVTSQIKAAEDFGSNGWMLWNPRNRYSAADLKR
jgi:hypothetical protein